MIQLLTVALLAGASLPQDFEKMLAAAKFSLTEAIQKGLAEAKSGVLVQAELEEEKGRFIYSLDIAQGNKVRNIALDARDAKVVENVVEDGDFSGVVGASRVTLAAAIETALRGSSGKAVEGALRLEAGKPVVRVKVFVDKKLRTVAVDAVTGTVQGAEPPAAQQDTQDEDRFTKVFGEDKSDLGPTGTNPFFVLEPGYTLVLEGKKGDKAHTITITVLADTKRIDGVETRAVEEREAIGGQVTESTRDYFAISRRTNNVYYFGEDVDVFKDGKLVGHEGSWLSGVNGARYGLMMAATPLLGARYYQEVAPGVAMDRAEVVSLSETLECPAGKFQDVLKTAETTPLEKGELEHKRYARGVGLLQDGSLKLTRYGKDLK